MIQYYSFNVICKILLPISIRIIILTLILILQIRQWMGMLNEFWGEIHHTVLRIVN